MRSCQNPQWSCW